MRPIGVVALAGVLMSLGCSDQSLTAGTHDDSYESGSIAQGPCAPDAYASGEAADAASAMCVPLTDCEPGEYVDSPATATPDRHCTACAEGLSSVGLNAATCAVGGTDCMVTGPDGEQHTASDAGPCDTASGSTGEQATGPWSHALDDGDGHTAQRWRSTLLATSSSQVRATW